MDSRKLLETLASLRGQIEEIQKTADPFSLHVHAARKIYRQDLDCRKHSRSTAWEYNVLKTFHEAQRLGYRGTEQEWMKVLRAGG